jgi:hypothetical protein
MEMSALELIFVPVLLTTVGSCVAGAAVLGLIRAIKAAVRFMLGRIRPIQPAHRAGSPGAPLSPTAHVYGCRSYSRILSKS